MFSPRLKSPCLHRELLTDEAVSPIIFFLRITALEVKMAPHGKSISSTSDNLSSILESMQMSASVYVCTCIHMYVFVCICICVCMCVCMHTHGWRSVGSETSECWYFLAY